MSSILTQELPSLKRNTEEPLDPEYCRRIWQQAIEEIPDWPGFKRIVLDQKDKAFLTENLDRGGGFD
jgi:hypothetical protein